MFIIRTAFWLGLVVFLLPSDKEAQGRLAMASRNVVQQVATMCERHASLCEHGAAAWTVFKGKAQVVGRMAFDLAMDRYAPLPSAQPAAGVNPHPQTSQHPRGRDERAFTSARGTLRDDDLAPRWRGDSARGRI